MGQTIDSLIKLKSSIVTETDLWARLPMVAHSLTEALEELIAIKTENNKERRVKPGKFMRLDHKTIQQIDDEAKRRNVQQYKIVEEALQAYLNQEHKIT